MPKIAAAYIRVSTEEQAEYSPASQLRQIQRYAQSHNMTVPKEFCYVDEGISGRQAQKRPAFMRMIARAKQKPAPFEAILVYSLSRFARNREDSIVYKTMLRKELHIDLISVTQDLGNDKSSILLEALLEAMDEYYSLNLAEEVRRGMNEKFSRGGVVSVPPFGYRMGDGRFVPDPEKASLIPKIFQDYLAGRSSRQIAAALNAAGIRTNRGKPFQSRTVDYILSNPTYTGKLRRRMHPGQQEMTLTAGEHIPLISEEVFLSAQQTLASRRRCLPPHARQSPADFMLRGLVRCGNCGATLTQSVRGKYLQCCRYARGQCSVSHSVSLAWLNDKVLEQLETDPACPARLKRSLPILRSDKISENEKNELLRSFLSQIVFRRPDNTITLSFCSRDLRTGR